MYCTVSYQYAQTAKLNTEKGDDECSSPACNKSHMCTPLESCAVRADVPSNSRSAQTGHASMPAVKIVNVGIQGNTALRAERKKERLCARMNLTGAALSIPVCSGIDCSMSRHKSNLKYSYMCLMSAQRSLMYPLSMGSPLKSQHAGTQCIKPIHPPQNTTQFVK